MQGKSWLFTVPNYTDEVLLHLQLVGESPDTTYLVVGREVAPGTGLPHLQCFIKFNSNKRFAAVQQLLPQCHLTCARGSAEQNRRYCTKDGDYEEWGTVPTPTQGRRSDWQVYLDWLLERTDEPTDRELIEAFPSLYGRYSRNMRSMAAEICPRPTLRSGTLLAWQSELLLELQQPPDDRVVRFFVDLTGGTGKSWFCGYAYTELAGVQLLGPGKRDDLAHAVDVRSTTFLFNMPRGTMEHLNYGLLEMLKDRMVLSPKYESTMKILRAVPHVVVFSNEEPDLTKMSEDRYNVTTM